MRQSETITKLAAALVKAQGELRSIGKDRNNTFFNSKYATLDAIIEHIRPALAKHGLAVVQGATTPETDSNGILKSFVVETMLIHESGEWLVNASIMPVAPQTKRDGTVLPIGPQAAGSAITYGRRYGLSALLSLATDDDDDANAANGNDTHFGQRRQAQRAREAAPAAPAPAAPVPAGVRVMPIGKRRGTPMAEIPTDDVKSALAWAQENQKERAVDVLMAELKDRGIAA